MNKHNWTPDEIRYIESHYKEEAYDTMGYALGLSYHAIRIKCIELGCVRHGNGRKSIEWSSDQLDYLRAHYPHDGVIDIADHLGYSYTTVLSKAKSLGLKKSEDYDVRKYRYRYVRNYRDERYKNFKVV